MSVRSRARMAAAAQLAAALGDAMHDIEVSEGQVVIGDLLRARIREVFMMMDTDGSGGIDRSEFHGAMARLGIRLSEAEAQEMLEVRIPFHSITVQYSPVQYSAPYITTYHYSAVQYSASPPSSPHHRRHCAVPQNADSDGNGNLDLEEFTDVVIEVLQDLEDKKRRSQKKVKKVSAWNKAQDTLVEVRPLVLMWHASNSGSGRCFTTQSGTARVMIRSSRCDPMSGDVCVCGTYGDPAAASRLRVPRPSRAITTTTTTPRVPRQSLGETLKDITIADDGESIVLGDKVKRRIREVFQDMNNGDDIDEAQFHSAMNGLGIELTREETDIMFAAADDDGMCASHKTQKTSTQQTEPVVSVCRAGSLEGSRARC